MMSRMGNIGGGEIVFIAIFALLVFGPKRLPEIGRSVGKALAELRRATNELKDGFTAGFEDLNEPLILNGPIKPRRVTPEAPPPASPGVPLAGPATPITSSDTTPDTTPGTAPGTNAPDPGPSGEDGASTR
jgi:sec-independent protein translocase protein TatA